MASAQTSPLVRFVRHVAAGRVADLSDDSLLERFVGRHDQEAFSALVRRHGPLVLGVCRRVLGDWHAAEDCLQGVFLVLAQKAGSLGRAGPLGPWLYGVAVRAALKVKAQGARRARRERKAAVPEAVEPAEDADRRDLRGVLDEVLARLPDKYRAPLVLHYLQGRTVPEAARELGCPEGTAAARLARGRRRLRAALAGRGITLAAALGALSAPASSKAGAAGLFAARAVLRGGFQAMLTSRFAVLAAGVFCVTVLAGAVRLSSATVPGDRPVAAEAPADTAEPIRFLSLAEAIASARKRRAPREDLKRVTLSVEKAYWDLYGAYWVLSAREEGLRLAYETWEGVRAKNRAGRATGADVGQARGQHELFRWQRREAVKGVREAERRLGELLEEGAARGRRLVPGDAPRPAPWPEEWGAGARRARARRAEAVRAIRAQREAFEEQLRARSKEYARGRATLDVVLEAQRFRAAALETEHQAVVEYTKARCEWAYGERGRAARPPRPPGEDAWRKAFRDEQATLGEAPTLAELWERTPPLKKAPPLPPDEAPGR